VFVLSLESSTRVASVALFNDSNCIEFITTDKPRSMSEFFNTQIESILLKENLDLKQIHHFAISTGPGSFTGIRVSGNITKTLAYSTKKKIWATDSLSILAEQADGAKNVLCCINAFKNMVYVASYKSKQMIDGPSVIKCSNINEYLSKNFLNDKLAVVGDGWEIISSELNSKFKEQTVYNSNLVHFPSAKTLGQMAIQKKSLNQTIDWNLYLPLYLRSSEAEENLRLSASE